ncbi:hypothetical protein F2Q69_00022562 [Brassica cretica]|uniref:Uncharacterized protein n=1 Tax=Brassica cretica TaxID=69181 RepID=A0A8S9QJ90_BRACR|nr:hypothetical protein F2Q69_00022562 [Brassica cretica]
MTLRSVAGKLLYTISFTYFFIEGDTFIASLNCISNVILSNAFLQIALSSSRLVYVFFGWKGGRVLYTLSTVGSAGVGSRSTFFPECRSIFTLVCRSAFVISCRSISTSSSISPSFSSRSMASSSVLGLSLPRGISDSVLGSSRIIGRDLLSPVSSTTTCFSVLLISIALHGWPRRIERATRSAIRRAGSDELGGSSSAEGRAGSDARPARPSVELD